MPQIDMLNKSGGKGLRDSTADGAAWVSRIKRLFFCCCCCCCCRSNSCRSRSDGGFRGLMRPRSQHPVRSQSRSPLHQLTPSSTLIETEVSENPDGPMMRRRSPLRKLLSLQADADIMYDGVAIADGNGFMEKLGHLALPSRGGSGSERRHSDHALYRRQSNQSVGGGGVSGAGGVPGGGGGAGIFRNVIITAPRIQVTPSESTANFDENAAQRPEGSGGLVLQHLPHQRRESFIYRSDSDFDVSPRNSRHSSITGELHSDEIIVTPFAQVLHTLRTVYEGVKTLTGADSLGGAAANHKETSCTSGSAKLSTSAASPCGVANDDEDFNQLASKTLKDLEWCLDQLETVQTHRSVADMASSKFKRLLNLELERMSGGRSQSHQIENYIKSTFFDLDENEATPPSSKPTATPASANCAQSTMTRVEVSAADAVKAAAAAAQSLAIIESKRLPLPPKFGVETGRLDELSALFDTGLDKWGVDIFLVDELACQKPLTAVVYAIFEKRDFFNKFRIHPAVLVNYFSQVEQHYKKENPYHNAIHAADVTQSTHVLLNAPSIANVFSELEILASIFACAIHDVNHPGVTNQFLINTESELAIMYNDMSVLENHHCAVAFKLLQESSSNVLAGLEDHQRRQLRKMVIDMVLATDMSKHMSLLADLKTMVETKKVAGGCLLKLDNYSEKMQIMQNMVHCADLSNPAKPLPLSTQWVTRVMEEFFNQGDREKALGLPVSPMCCRETANVEKSQMSFIDFIVHPLWEAWTELVHPDAEHILNTLEQNRDHYCELSAAKEAEAVKEVDEEHLDEADRQ